MPVTFDRHSLLVAGRRKVIRSGAMHYFRLPHPDLWRDRLLKLKAAGYNTVDLYFNWDFHSPAPGEYDFTGIRDVKRLLEMVQEVGLYLIARPGPYINAETSRGGLPGWLLAEPDVVLRCREDGKHRESPRFVGFVREWFDQILPFIKSQPNLLMIQVENEYGTEDMEPDYMLAVRELIRAHGITAPTMHNDFYAAGLYADLVDLYALDNYSVTVFDMDWRAFPHLFSVLDHLEEQLRPDICPNRPMMVAELQAGWFAGWKGVPYDAIYKSLRREHIGLVTRSVLGQGVTLFNHYKAIGGTNWDHIGGTDVYTSYDFSAPISETGLPTERLYEAKRINMLLSHFDLSRTERVPPETIGLSASDSFYTLREDLNHPGAYWLFTRNITGQHRQITLDDNVLATTAPYTGKILPYRLPLQNGWQLQCINVEPLAQTANCLLLPGNEAVTLVIQSTEDKLNPTASAEGVTFTSLGPDTLRIDLPHAVAPDRMASARVGDTTIYFLGSQLTDRVWHLGPDHYVIGPDMVRDTREWFGDTCSAWYELTPGQQGLKTISVKKQEPPAILPELADWTVVPDGVPLWSEAGYRPISPTGSDMDHNDIFNGALWYRYPYSGVAKTLSIRAEHIWGVFLNGIPVLQHHTFRVHPETSGPEDTVEIPLPATLQSATGENVLVIFVDTLGHHKGFYDDARSPLGLLSLTLDGRDIHLQGGIQAALTEIPAAMPSTLQVKPEAPIIHLTTRFTLDLPETVLAPVGLELNSDIERINITLNGMLIGRHWRACNNQTRFYLPDGVLNRHGENELTLTCIQLSPMLSIENFARQGYGKVQLVYYAWLPQQPD